MPEWHPSETAPKDFSSIFLKVSGPSGTREIESHYLPNENGADDWWRVRPDEKIIGWRPTANIYDDLG